MQMHHDQREKKRMDKINYNGIELTVKGGVRLLANPWCGSH
jgi:hypothetical protein